MKISVILPSLNPDEKLMLVVNGLIKEGFEDIIIVNDGSDEAHMQPFKEASTHKEVTVLIHEVNKGKGRALKTAMSIVLPTDLILKAWLPLMVIISTDRRISGNVVKK